MRSLKLGVGRPGGALLLAAPRPCRLGARRHGDRSIPVSTPTTQGASCTANFIFTQGGDVFIGDAAHCPGTGAATDTNGCDAGHAADGTAVEVDGAIAARHARLQLVG